MKRFVSITLVALMLVSIAVTALAYDGTVAAPANTWKTVRSYVTRVASGSFWKATFTDASKNTASRAYLYKQYGDRCTLIESFTLDSARTGLNYLSGQAVTGAMYKLNAIVTKEDTISYYFNP